MAEEQEATCEQRDNDNDDNNDDEEEYPCIDDEDHGSVVPLMMEKPMPNFGNDPTMTEEQADKIIKQAIDTGAIKEVDFDKLSIGAFMCYMDQRMTDFHEDQGAVFSQEVHLIEAVLGKLAQFGKDLRLLEKRVSTLNDTNNAILKSLRLLEQQQATEVPCESYESLPPEVKALLENAKKTKDTR